MKKTEEIKKEVKEETTDTEVRVDGLHEPAATQSYFQQLGVKI